jgi:hypothetical protein
MTKPNLPLSNVLYNVQVYRGVTGGRKLLSCSGTGDRVDLWTTDDDSNRQKWQFIPLPDGTYNIRVYGGVNNGRVLLSCGGTGERVDLWTTDDGSGRQRWTLEPLTMGCFRIRVKGGVNSGRALLSCSGDGTRVDLWTTDDNSGRQQWVLVPEDVELDRIEFSLASAATSTRPDFVDESVVDNAGSGPAIKTATFTKKAKFTSSFEQQHSFSFRITGSKNFGTPVFVSGSLEVSAETTNTWTYAESQTREDTRSYSLQVTVPPQKRGVVTVAVTMMKLDVPYVAYGTSKLTGETVSVAGIWQGISAGQIAHRVTEEPL